MKLFLFSLLLLNLALIADDKYIMRMAYGTASQNDLGQIITGNPDSTDKALSVMALDGGYLLKENFLDLPIDIYIKGGLSAFNEKVNNNTYEALAYIKAYYNIDFLDNRIRIGLGEGFSYTSRILEVEYDEVNEDPNNISSSARFLNYLDITVDFDVGKLINYKPMHDTYLGYLLKHRSGIAGLINNVDHGGSNYNAFYIEKKF
jgi:outer membrane protein